MIAIFAARLLSALFVPLTACILWSQAPLVNAIVSYATILTLMLAYPRASIWLLASLLLLSLTVMSFVAAVDGIRYHGWLGAVAGIAVAIVPLHIARLRARLKRNPWRSPIGRSLVRIRPSSSWSQRDVRGSVVAHRP